MKYVIMKNTLNERKEREITKKEYLELKSSQNILNHARAIEETFDLIINNYFELETKIYELSLDYVLHTQRNYYDFYHSRAMLNAKLINLLTSVTLYRDTLTQHAKNCLPENRKIKEEIKEIIEKQRETNLEFDFIENLRNYLQHKGLPIHNLSYNGRRTSLDEDAMIEYSLEFQSFRETLFDDSRIKEKFENKLEKEIDLKRSTRIYIESIGEIHLFVRNKIEENVNKNRKIIKNAQRNYSDDKNESFVGLRAYILDNNKVVDSIPLLLEWDDVRIELIKRNNNLKNLRKCYVTGAIQKRS